MSGAVELGQIRVDTSLSTGTHMNSTTGPTPNRIQIWQQNLNKSRATHEDLINSDVYKSFDILVLQEPYTDKLGNTKATRDWRVAYLSSHLTGNRPTQAVIVNARVNTNKWVQLTIQDTGNLVQFRFLMGSVKYLYSGCTMTAITPAH